MLRLQKCYVTQHQDARQQAEQRCLLLIRHACGARSLDCVAAIWTAQPSLMLDPAALRHAESLGPPPTFKGPWAGLLPQLSGAPTALLLRGAPTALLLRGAPTALLLRGAPTALCCAAHLLPSCYAVHPLPYYCVVHPLPHCCTAHLLPAAPLWSPAAPRGRPLPVCLRIHCAPGSGMTLDLYAARTGPSPPHSLPSPAASNHVPSAVSIADSSIALSR